MGSARRYPVHVLATSVLSAWHAMGEIIQINLTCARLLRVEHARLSNKFFDVFVAKADHPTFNAFLQQVFTTESRQICEVRLDRKDSRTLTVYIEAALSAD